MKKILLIALFLLGCETPQEQVNSLVYIKDARTHLCYATFEMGQNFGLLTNVPCSSEVEQAIDQDKSKSQTFRGQ